ncbi:MAG TPA: amidohydrolase family protein [Candidatus Limnocylindria bacterium]|nr:amidohydrolase family protein [Candidatus Limnocylindria bacterium]
MTFKTWRSVVAVIACGLSMASAWAGSVLLTGATIHTVSGPNLANGSLLIRDGKIAAIGVRLTEPADKTVDLKGQHLYPGLISPTTVLGLVEIDSVRATHDVSEAGEYTPDVYTWMAVNPDSEHIPVTRANGYTHVEAIPRGGIVSGFSGVIQLAGWTIEDLAVKRVAALHLNWPSFNLDTTPKDKAANKDRWKSIEDQVKEREKRIKEIDDFFTEAEAYAKAKTGSGASNGFKVIPAWEAMLPVLKREVPIFLHAEEYRQIKSAVEWSLRRKYRASLIGGRDAWRLASTLATNRIDVAYDAVFDQPGRDTDPYDVHYAAPGILSAAGVKVSFSEGPDHMGASNIRNTPYDAAQAVAFGLSPEEALRGLTMYPAQLLGVGDRLGTIEIGKDASLFVADGDILDLRAHVTRMWIAGEEVSLENRQSRLYEKYRGRPKK